MRQVVQRSARFWCVVLCSAAAFACDSSSTAPAAASDPGEVVDGRNGGDPRFFFLQPYGFDPAPDFPLDLDIGSSLVVEICAGSGAGCLGAPFARYSRAGGPGGERIQVCSTCPAYFVSWNTADFALQPEATYRLRVRAADRELGHADLRVVYSSSEAVDARREGFIPVFALEALSVYFKIVGQSPPPPPPPPPPPQGAYQWSARASLPVAVRAAAAASDGRRIYVFGGNQGFAAPSTLVQIYDPATNRWSLGAPFVGARDWAMAAALGDGIHLLNGESPEFLREHRVYDPRTDSWSSRRASPIGAEAAAVAVVGGRLYVIGGAVARATPTGAVQVYDPATDSWSLGASMPTARFSAAVAVLGGKVYVAAGQTAGVGTTNVLERYDPVADSWTSLAPLPQALDALGGGRVGDRFCVFGGRRAEPNPTGAAFARTYCYDPSLNTWGRAPTCSRPAWSPPRWNGTVPCTRSGAARRAPSRARRSSGCRPHRKAHESP